MKHRAYIIIAAVWMTLALAGCMKYGPLDEEGFDFSGSAPNDGLFITNEGNFMYGNASLSYYVPSSGLVENEVFIRANGINLGDVAQSMVIRDGLGYVVVNNSGVVFVIDINTFRVVGSVAGLTSPRYIHFLSDTKAYITDLYEPRITIFDPSTLKVTGYIDTKGHRSTEQMVQYGRYVFTNCWSYDDKILVIDTERDEVVDEIKVGIQPTSLALDRYGKIWTITDGGYEGSPVGYQEPELVCIDAETRVIERTFRFPLGDAPSEVTLNGRADTLYFINKDVWRMDVAAMELPSKPFLKYNGTRYYGLAVDPHSSDVYVADALDYVQPGIVYRFTAGAVPVDTMRVGITPGAFCFR